MSVCAAWLHHSRCIGAEKKEKLMPKPRLTIDGRVFRDLNGNGKLDIYEDPRQPVEARVEDLLQQLTLAEKAGLMFHGFAFMT
ncbi:MAG: hypothetical protein RLZZ297_1506, partial [Chloroflexota bacterium]